MRLPLVSLVAVCGILFPLSRSASATDFSTLQWANQAIHLQQAWQFVPGRGAGATVCDVDSGVTLNHPDLKAAIAGGVNTVDPTTPTSYSDDDGHGTYTAGIMVARGADIWGVAPGASLLVAKAMNGKGAGSAMSVTSGILWCISQGAQVVNLSLGGQSSAWDGFKQAIAFGCRHGVDFAVAAGNDSTSKEPVNPASVDSPCLIAVNASDQHNQLAGFSNYQENPRTVTAPGAVVVSDWTNGGVTLGSGTSASAPFVAGVMALLRSRGASAQDAVNLILASASHPGNLKFVHGTNPELGHGLLNAAAACEMYTAQLDSASVNRSWKQSLPSAMRSL